MQATVIRAAFVGLGALAAAAAGAQVAPLQTQETNKKGVVAELTECRRSEGVLTIKVRLRNSSDESVYLPILDGSDQYDNLYAVASGRKYLVLRDTEGKPFAVSPTSGRSIGASIEKGGSFQWWAKYPAPPAEVKKLTYVTTFSGPFENVPISDQ